ncbi:MAG: uracil phosphoribosyltransferase [Actinobacteria bacterium]|nr:uracil phosphoribosyltransferase [Actinomycetota bacterium]
MNHGHDYIHRNRIFVAPNRGKQSRELVGLLRIINQFDAHHLNMPAAMELLPDANIAVVGVQRDEKTHAPSEYVAKLPSRLDNRTCLVLDPMLATGGSLAHGCKLLADRGAPMPLTIACVLAAPEGIEFLRSTGMNLHIITASVDSHLNENAFIVPGLGDAGDRQFGPPLSTVSIWPALSATI